MPKSDIKLLYLVRKMKSIKSKQKLKNQHKLNINNIGTNL